MSQLEQSEEGSDSGSALEKRVFLNDKIRLETKETGIVKYIGYIPFFNENLCYGVDITKGTGENNGTVDTMYYFKTRNQKSGVFVLPQQITKNITSFVVL